MPFNREDIQIIPNPGLHSQADILIYFPKSQVLCMGDLLLSQNCPAVQDVAGYMDFLDKILDIFPSGVTFVGGHGKDLTADGLKKYRDDLAGMVATVKKMYAAGRSAGDMIRGDVLRTTRRESASWIRSAPTRGLPTASPGPGVRQPEVECPCLPPIAGVQPPGLIFLEGIKE